MSEANWEEEREKLLESLQKANQVALESQAEAAVYRDMLEDCYEAARQAIARNDISLLPKLVTRTMFFTTPDREDVKEWGKYFLDAYMRDAGWLKDTQKALEQIKADAEELSKDNEINDELRKRVMRILAAAKEGLVTHI